MQAVSSQLFFVKIRKIISTIKYGYLFVAHQMKRPSSSLVSLLMLSFLPPLQPFLWPPEKLPLAAHLPSDVIGGTDLSDVGPLEVRIGGKVLDPATPSDVDAGRGLAISVTPLFNTFRGFLVHVSKGTGVMMAFLDVTDDSNVQVLGRCTNIGIGGISHNIGSNTGAVKGTVMDDLLQEVTVLIRNGDESIWRKSDYVVNAKRQVGADGSVGFSVACFSGEVMISVQNKGAVAIKDLSLQ